MIYVVNTGLIDANLASGIGMAFEKPKKQNMPTLRPEELPKLMRSLVMSNLSVSTRWLIEWQLLTFVGPSEASGTRWIDNIEIQTQATDAKGIAQEIPGGLKETTWHFDNGLRA